MFEFDFTLTDEDYIDFYIYRAFHVPYMKKRLLLIRWVPSIFVFLMYLSEFLDAGRANISSLITSFLLTELLCAVWVLLAKPFVRWNEKRAYFSLKKAEKRPFDNHIFMRFQDDSFVRGNSEFESKFKYPVIENVVVTERAVYIFNSAVNALILPMSLFADRNSVNVFVGFLEEKRRQAQ